MPTVNLQPINLGGYANDGTGDDLRTAFEKVNGNFSEISAAIPSKLIDDPAPTLAANLNLNNKNLFSNAPVLLNIGTNKFTASGPIQATSFIGQITSITNHSLTNLSDVEYIRNPINEDGLVYRDGIWQPGPVNAAFATVDGGAASAVFNLTEGAVVDGGRASD